MAKSSLVRIPPSLSTFPTPCLKTRTRRNIRSFPLTCLRPVQSAQLHILRALAKWPKDVIRPQVQLQDVLRKRFEANQTGLSETEQLQQANALYSLLDNRYKKKVRSLIPRRPGRTKKGRETEPSLDHHRSPRARKC